jgi:uncharacterized circularly permuted ATP-grasp superfamily protein
VSPHPVAGYAAPASDEVVDGDGRLRGGYAVLEPGLARVGAAGLRAAVRALAAERAERGATVSGWRDGRSRTLPFAQDPLPRVLSAAEWRHVAVGVEQRHRALTAFLAEAYRAAGRRRGDADRAPEVVRAGVLPEWAVAHSPARDPEAVGLAWPGQPRATLAAADVVRTADGRWTVVADHLQVPPGLGHALTNRTVGRAAVPELYPAGDLVDPADAVPLLRRGLASAAPPGCPRPPRIAVLTAGEGDGGWFEHRVLAAALDVPLVRPMDIWPRLDGGLEASVGGERIPFDVLFRRFDDAALGAYRTPVGRPLSVVLAEAVRAGTLGLANVPGNGLADDAALYAWVPRLIGHYLGEQPLLDSTPTWVLADHDSWAQVRDRLHELVLTPVAGYGGGRTVVGPECTAAQLAELEAEVAAAPHRFVAREPVPWSTQPVVTDTGPVPRHADLRVFSVAGPEPCALPAPLTRVAPGPGSTDTDPGRGAGTKDTWLLT